MGLANWFQSVGRKSSVASSRKPSFRPRLLHLEDRAVPASLFADFNGDGYDDVAVGAPTDAAGAVDVIFGSPDGLGASRSQHVTQANLGVAPNKMNDLFGWSLAAGDFNGDGYDDLAIGAPDEIPNITADP